MNQPSLNPDGWTPEMGARLKNLMQTQGVSEFQLAQVSALSVRQIRALIDPASVDFSVCFYSVAIRDMAGHKLLSKLMRS